MNWRRAGGLATLAAAVLLVLGGAALVAGYVQEAVLARWGDPDQSLLFWYLPILFLGLAGLALGLTCGYWGRRWWRTDAPPRQRSNG